MYHIGRNLWYRMETRTVKNVCAPAAVIDDKIYIVGGKEFFFASFVNIMFLQVGFEVTVK